MRRKKNKETLKRVFIFITCIYLAFAVFKLTDPALWRTRIIAPNGPIKSVPGTKLPPVEVKIDSIKIDLAISAGLVDGNTWDLYDDKIAWLATSAVPGEGNVILYGHDRHGLFGDLYKLKIGDVVQVKKGADWFSYKVTEVKRVQPNDVVSILSDKNRLTMYTCDGSFDQRRLVVYAE